MPELLNRPSCITIPLNMIVDGNSPRIEPNQAGIKELATCISSVGLLHPPGVIEVDTGQYRIAYGHRRTAAARSLGWPEITVQVIGTQCSDVASIVENIQREDLTPRESGIAFKALLDTGGWNQSELAIFVGKSKSWVSRMVKLGESIAEHGDTVSFTKLPLGTYWELLDAPTLLGMAETEGWDQKKARRKATLHKKLIQNPKANHQSPLIRIGNNATTASNGSDIDLASFQPVRFFNDGFEIRPFKYSKHTGLDVEAVREIVSTYSHQLEAIMGMLNEHLNGSDQPSIDSATGETSWL